MKIKPLTIFALLALTVAGVIYYSDKISSSKQTTVAVQPTTPSPTPLASPNRELKPNEKFIAPAGLYITVPEGMNFRQEVASDSGDIRYLGFYIENESGYQLYGLYQAKSEASQEALEINKKGMDPSTIKDVEIGGYKGVEGLVTGPKNRYLTVIIKNGKFITLSTIPPTLENKAITDQIFSTINFQ
ncbi:hypothetical protein A2778_05695 [Candidatus Daviesbacteria bacterium RIFCSPHIGHO2_01_FULL_40_24]|uniref:DUF4367 domain-containing protein n=1 Tax=Candidatus Daviesbacteria bacterium GW2011_GWC2_40_12 TaxID=1618431 RepID=A0A0G0QZA4_9BACT|nr:MAG: hypothetical protein UT45_C0001G0069 [Candidatus Daviesbacteria bacterium GW2011_GWA2_39_33]KKR42771.1 MAG: hypothetical protein UT77_C0001G0222 [Candidatus Daviesbacteria bacterium GW2011_GWC2_40_12]OGE21646.1 MAG: hypothetical protein A2778_05695 [Candidatus Daviesbacteria bacterium RIFCSPHIGHO2_01_FULL_40_24]OGE30043.1 MAG: hypothetical protein A3C29_01400 [Candidatus Daviesbacteria bacterium RIFCSPHIGHO2_02_FULL_40_16]OGE43522.1 MAG: hypothetical protein A3A53_02715 [Candidatus Davi